MDSEDFNLDQTVESAVNWASSPISLTLEKINLTPSIEFFSHLELKALLKHLKYIYLGEQETLPVIITSHLTVGQEENLISVLRKHKKAIGWTMNDIKGLSPAIFNIAFISIKKQYQRETRSVGYESTPRGGVNRCKC